MSAQTSHATPFGALAGEAPEPDASLSRTFAQLELELRMGLALASSRDLRRKVLEGRPSVVLALPMNAGWIHVGPEDLRLSRDPAGGSAQAARSITALLDDDRLNTDPALRRHIEGLTEAARRLVWSLFADDRKLFNELLTWAPLVEATAYVAATRVMERADTLRPRVLNACASRAPDADTLAGAYRHLVHIIGRATLLATEAGAPWLADTALSFAWVQWTPSFPLTRERDRWTSSIGVRAAARFGPRVIERYLEAFGRATHPLKALDALVALTAIARAHPAESPALTRAFEAEIARGPRATMLRPELVTLGLVQARRALDPASAVRAGALGRKGDSFSLDSTNAFPVFGLIAEAVASPPAKLLGATAATLPMSPRVAREIFAQAWGPGDLDLASLPASAFGRA